MSESATRTQIYTILIGVSNIGKVYDYERWNVNWGAFINLFKSTTHNQIRGAEIGRKAPVTFEKDGIRTHTYFIRMYMAVDDSAATEKTFNTLVDTVVDTFAANLNLNAAANGSEYIQVDALDTRTFGSVLCHFAELTLTVYDYTA